MTKSKGKKIIHFVMGLQRSGGSTLLDAFRRNRNVSILREKNKRIFDYFMLRPESEIRPLLQKTKLITLIEAKSETKQREVKDLFAEFSEYSVKIIWNYRNPVSVYYSRLIKYPHKDWVADEIEFCKMWNQRNASVINALTLFQKDIAIVKLEDLIENKMVFNQLCDFIGVKGRNKFYSEKPTYEKALSDSIITTINEQTSSILAQLGLNRRFIP
jgi:hypothetical protein